MPSISTTFSTSTVFMLKLLWRFNFEHMTRLKYGRKTIKTICKNCGCEFEKILAEYKRSEENHKNHYCSRSCCGKDNINRNLGTYCGNGDIRNFKGVKPAPRIDEFTGFRRYFTSAKKRNKLGDITLIDIKEQWEKQNGVCPYTGIKLILPSYRMKCKGFELASLDRIVSSKPYEKGNIVFVSVSINYMKNTMSVEDTIILCKKIALFWKDK